MHISEFFLPLIEGDSRTPNLDEAADNEGEDDCAERRSAEDVTDSGEADVGLVSRKTGVEGDDLRNANVVNEVGDAEREEPGVDAFAMGRKKRLTSCIGCYHMRE